MTRKKAVEQLENQHRYEYRCKICSSGFAADIDQMLSDSAGYDEVIAFAGERKLQLSYGGISRHNHKHRLGPPPRRLDSDQHPEEALRVMLSKLTLELRTRGFDKLSKKELLLYTRATSEVLVAVMAAKDEGSAR